MSNERKEGYYWASYNKKNPTPDFIIEVVVDGIMSHGKYIGENEIVIIAEAIPPNSSLQPSPTAQVSAEEMQHEAEEASNKWWPTPELKNPADKHLPSSEYNLSRDARDYFEQGYVAAANKYIAQHQPLKEDIDNQCIEFGEWLQNNARTEGQSGDWWIKRTQYTTEQLYAIYKQSKGV